ncbi:hypothetical protein GCM10025859_63620 [Alicyclobacillus fastidiosus]|nr:hypothetical protein GCM10025859_61870 [Alicyclobacillus fastidiosus]GMA65921.1 hypothetical protein GCM10025859_63620 [Alicyclobacillus fastidiosus]
MIVGDNLRKFLRAFGLVGGGILFAVLVVWLGPIIFRGHLTSVSSELNFIAFLATLVGGIMAAAGLIVALVSVLSFRALDERVENKFNQLAEQDEKARRTQTNSMFQGFASQLQSISTLDLYQSERFTEQALSLYPDLAGSRRQMALRFFRATEDAFISKYRDKTLPRGKVYFPETIQSDSYAHEAEKWLERAKQHGEDNDKYLTFCLAKLYGMRGRYDLMNEALAESIPHIENVHSQLFRLIATCAYSCDSEERLNKLASTINATTPMNMVEMFELLEIYKESWNTPFFLCRLKVNGLNLYKLPSLFMFRIYSNDQGEYRINFIGDDPYDIKRVPVEPDSEQWFTKEEAWNIISNEGWVLYAVSDE